MTKETAMTTIVAWLLFATAFGAACWTIWATVAPQARRIVELLAHGPVEALPAPVTSRSGARGPLRRREVPRPAPLRAAA